MFYMFQMFLHNRRVITRKAQTSCRWWAGFEPKIIETGQDTSRPGSDFSILLISTYFNFFFIFQQGRLQNVSEGEVLSLNVKRMCCHIGYSLPVPLLHGFVGHELQERNHFIEVINSLLQVLKSLPVFQGTRQLATSGRNNDLYRPGRKCGNKKRFFLIPTK